MGERRKKKQGVEEVKKEKGRKKEGVGRKKGKKGV